MPKILEVNGYKYYLYTDDHLPIHIHVLRGGSEAKIILEPEIWIKNNYGFKSQELRQILSTIVEHNEFIIAKWYEIHYK